ncbi:MAG: [FeFe] hydrogenase H-cluster radical SAM maturase HydE [Candidatus Sabulitectum sp.]|nr:[FeFe] hydrogenase H-cluster radical SAM maturase HydE [Candidatus Sabulitectum sp.]
MTSISDSLLQKTDFTVEEICSLLKTTGEDNTASLFNRACMVKNTNARQGVHFRGIIELSNICERDCLYCGIRRSNLDVTRFQMTKQQILDAALWTHKAGYGSLVIQAGERRDAGFIDFIEEILREIKQLSCGSLGITLSLGEQSKDVYARWFEAGAHRYLLRIETSDPLLYRQIHPLGYSFEERVACLGYLRETGYQVGTGVMIGLPGQTVAQLASDILFFKKNDIDMIGMGPYIPHHSTPMSQKPANCTENSQFELALKMIAVTRIVLKDVNIAATTALQALKSDGRELGLKAGANIIMPNVTGTEYRTGYQLYDNKPCMDENSEVCRENLVAGIKNAGETVIYGKWGDSKHFFKRRGMESLNDPISINEVSGQERRREQC